MKREDYMELIDNDAEEINLTNEDIKEWLDAQVDALIQYNNARYDLCWGQFNEEDGEYEHNVEPCGEGEKSIHIFKGIKYLADVVGQKLDYRVIENAEYANEYFFIYRGITVFQLEKEGGLL